MKKKRIIRLVMVTMFAAAVFSGCGNSSKEDAESTAETVTTTTPTETPTTEDILDETIEILSDTEENFEKVFKVELTDYTQSKDVATGTMDKITYESSVIGETRDAYVYTPAGYSADVEYPVMYVIHGIGCDLEQWINMGVANIFDNMIASGEIKPFVAVFPSILPPGGKPIGVVSDENIQAFTDFKAEFLEDLEPYIFDNYFVSKERTNTAVCGLSMGGMEALRLGFSIKDHFNYIGSFSAAPTLDTSLLTLEGCKYTPALVLVCNGDSDSTVKDTPKEYHEVLMENVVDHIWYEFPGGNHEPKVWNNGIINFLKRSFT